MQTAYVVPTDHPVENALDYLGGVPIWLTDENDQECPILNINCMSCHQPMTLICQLTATVTSKQERMLYLFACNASLCSMGDWRVYRGIKQKKQLVIQPTSIHRIQRPLFESHSDWSQSSTPSWDSTSEGSRPSTPSIAELTALLDKRDASSPSAIESVETRKPEMNSDKTSTRCNKVPLASQPILPTPTTTTTTTTSTPFPQHYLEFYSEDPCSDNDSFISTDNQETPTLSDYSHELELLRQYQQDHPDIQLTSAMESLSLNAPLEWQGEQYEDTSPDFYTSYFRQFSVYIQKDPQACLRWGWNQGHPIYMSDPREDNGSTRVYYLEDDELVDSRETSMNSSGTSVNYKETSVNSRETSVNSRETPVKSNDSPSYTIPPCSLCHQDRIFEMQLLPHSLDYFPQPPLSIPSSITTKDEALKLLLKSDHLDFATVIVFTCGNNCIPTHGVYVPEVVVVQKDLLI